MKNSMFSASATIQYKSYVNHRDGIIKNGGCIVSWHGLRLGYLYAIVDTCGTVVAVKKEGILANKLLNNMKSDLLFVMRELEAQQSAPRNLFWNEIDSPVE